MSEFREGRPDSIVLAYGDFLSLRLDSKRAHELEGQLARVKVLVDAAERDHNTADIEPWVGVSDLRAILRGDEGRH